MAYFQRALARCDVFQQRRTWLSFPVAVARKMGNDQGGSLAALVAHYGFLSVFPLILIFSSVLGFVLGGNASLKAHVIATIARSFPALSGFVTKSIQGSGLALGVGSVVALWAGLGVTRATERAMNSIWDIPLAERPNLWWSRIRGLFMLIILGLTFLLSTGLASLQQASGALAIPVAVLSVLGPLALNFGLYLLAFQVLTNRHLPWRSIVPGALVGTIGWTLLQSVGAIYTRHVVAHASQLYGTLAWVIGLLAWIYLGALLTLYAAEVNVVLAHRLWPRSLSGSPKTDADRRAVVLLAREYERTSGEIITVGFTPGGGKSAPVSRQTENIDRSMSAAQAIHHDVSELVVHLKAFDRYSQEFEQSTDADARERFSAHLHAEADDAVQALGRLVQHESILADALVRRLP